MNFIKCKVSSMNLNEEKIYEIMKFEQKNEEEKSGRNYRYREISKLGKV